MCAVAAALLLGQTWIADGLRSRLSPWLGAFVIALLPAAVLAAWSRSAASLPVLLAGMLLGFAVQEWLLLPRLGWLASTALWTVAWLASERRYTQSDAPAAAAGRLWSLAAWAFALALAAGFLRPLIFQSIEPTRIGWRAAGCIALAGLAAGAWVGREVTRAAGARVGIAVGLLLLAFAAWATWGGLHAGRDVYAGANRDLAALGASWGLLGFPAVAFGWLLVQTSPRGVRSVAALLVGLAAGTWAAERAVLPRLVAARENALPIVSGMSYHAGLGDVASAAIDPEGLATRQKARIGSAAEDVIFWQARAWARAAAWARLEEAEIRFPHALRGANHRTIVIGHLLPTHERALETLGLDLDSSSGDRQSQDHASLSSDHVRVVDPLPAFSGAAGSASPLELTGDDSYPAASYIQLSMPVRTLDASLDETTGFLYGRLHSSDGDHWVWCDLRTLTPDGLRTLLATWRAARPRDRLCLLQDGHAGPLLGLLPDWRGDQTAATLPAELRDLVLLEGPVSALVRPDLARPATLDRPALEWQVPRDPSPFDHPVGDVMQALTDALDLAAHPGMHALLEALAIHAASQQVRGLVSAELDRITIGDDEIAVLLRALKVEPGLEATVRQMTRTAQTLYDKREYGMVVAMLEQALVLRHDVAAFHHHVGRAYRELLDVEGAVGEYEVAIALDPTARTPKLELARIRAEHQEWLAAVELLEQVWRDDATPDWSIAKGLGMGYVELGRFAEARPLLEFAEQAGPYDHDVLTALDLAREQVR